MKVESMNHYEMNGMAVTTLMGKKTIRCYNGLAKMVKDAVVPGMTVSYKGKKIKGIIECSEVRIRGIK